MKYFFISLISIFLLQTGNLSYGLESYYHGTGSVYVELIVIPSEVAPNNPFQPILSAVQDNQSTQSYRGFINEITYRFLYSEYSNIFPNFVEQLSINIHPIIRILHKKYKLYQSSDDEIPLNYSSI
jgi:hypothetical protein